MERYLAALLLILFLPAVGLGGPVATHTSNVPLYNFMPKGTGLSVTREVMAITWNSYSSEQAELSPPRVVMNKTILMSPIPGGFRPAGDMGKIQQGSLYWASLEQAYQQAVKYTEDIPKVGIIEINRLVFGMMILNVDDGYPASMAVHLIAMFRRAIIPDNSILIGTLQPDGRIGTVSALSAKIRLLIPYSQKLFIPSGQLATLNPTLTTLLQQHSVTVEEVDTIEQAYQLMVRTR